MRRSLLAAFWGLFVPFGFSASGTIPFARNVNVFTDYPFPAIGNVGENPEIASVPKLFADQQFDASGTLFLSPRIVLTVAHGTYYTNGNPITRIEAVFSCKDGSSLKVSGTVLKKGKGREVPSHLTHSGDDWALALLDQPVPARCATPLKAFSGSAQDLYTLQNHNIISLFGYSLGINGGRLSISSPCKIIAYDRDNAGEILHCCDATAGASGGPITIREGGWYEVAAMQNRAPKGGNYASCTPANANGAVFSSVFNEQARKLMEQLDNNEPPEAKPF